MTGTVILLICKFICLVWLFVFCVFFCSRFSFLFVIAQIINLSFFFFSFFHLSQNVFTDYGNPLARSLWNTGKGQKKPSELKMTTLITLKPSLIRERNLFLEPHLQIKTSLLRKICFPMTHITPALR
jgi:hypothetical protein